MKVEGDQEGEIVVRDERLHSLAFMLSSTSICSGCR